MSASKRGLQRKSDKPRAGDSHVFSSFEGQDKSAWIVPIEKIIPDPDQPRKQFDESTLQSLADDIAVRGIRNPITVYSDNGQYRIIAGERRYKAAHLAKLKDLPVRVIEPQNILEEQIIENLQREDLNPVDEAEALAKLKTEGDYSVRALAERLHQSKSSIDRKLSILKMPEGVQKKLRQGQLSFSEAEQSAKEPTVKKAKKVGRPAHAFKLNRKKNGGFDLSLKYRPEETNREDVIQKLEEILEELKKIKTQ